MEKQIVDKIFDKWKEHGDAEPARVYMGASILGHECDAFLWFSFRGCFHEGHAGRLYRLFDRGKREEAVFVSELRSIGAQVWDVDDEGQQFAVSALGGHLAGHLDGVGRGIPGAMKMLHVLEFKTHSDSSFKALLKQGVQKAKPIHYAQMTIYMGLQGFTRALYLAVNKDTDDLYAERVHFDQEHFEHLLVRAKRIMEENDPVRCADRPDDWRCKMCPAQAVCWNLADHIYSPTTPPDCRTCCHSTPITEGEGAVWSCQKGCKCGPGQCCDGHLALPSLIHGCLDNGDPEHVVYTLPDTDIQFTNGNGGFSTKELQVLTPSAITSDAVVHAKEIFGGTVTGVKQQDDADHSPLPLEETLC